MKVVYDENMPAIPQLLGPEVETLAANGRNLDASQLRDAEALLVRSVTQVDADLLAGTPVRYVGSATSGIDHVDTQWLSTAGIAFAHASGANANSVVEYVLSAIAACDDFLERLLDGGRAGIVGYGHVGRALGRRLDALDIDWCASDPWLERGDVPRPAQLDALLDCDVICLHPELTHESPWPSYHLFDRSRLDRLGAGQLLINASRGPVIDGRALLQRLQSARPPVTVLDVWEGEPQVDPALLQRVRIGTAHIAGYSLDSKLRASAQVVAGLQRYLGWPSVGAWAEHTATIWQLLPGGGFAGRLRALLLQSSPIERDDNLLRQTVLGGDATGQGFDRLRREYAERRELAGSRFTVTTGDAEAVRLIQALDGVPVTEGG